MYITILSTAALHQTCRGRHVRVDRLLPNSDEKQRTVKSRKLKGQSKNSSLEGIQRISLFRDDVGRKCNYLSIRDMTELVEKVMEEQRQVLTCWLVDWWDVLQCCALVPLVRCKCLSERERERAEKEKLNHILGITQWILQSNIQQPLPYQIYVQVQR